MVCPSLLRPHIRFSGAAGGLVVSTLPTGRWSNTRYGVTTLLLERVIIQGVPSVAAWKVEMAGTL